jgi:hypothetical protein
MDLYEEFSGEPAARMAIAMKTAAGRPQDLADVARLEEMDR